jgi:hypothetical protein
MDVRMELRRGDQRVAQTVESLDEVWDERMVENLA